MWVIHLYNGDATPWSTTWVTGFMRNGHEASGSLMVVEPGNGEGSNDVYLFGSNPNDPNDQITRLEVEARTSQGDQVAEFRM